MVSSGPGSRSNPAESSGDDSDSFAQSDFARNVISRHQSGSQTQSQTQTQSQSGSQKRKSVNGKGKEATLVASSSSSSGTTSRTPIVKLDPSPFRPRPTNGNKSGSSATSSSFKIILPSTAPRTHGRKTVARSSLTTNQIIPTRPVVPPVSKKGKEEKSEKKREEVKVSSKSKVVLAISSSGDDDKEADKSEVEEEALSSSADELLLQDSRSKSVPARRKSVLPPPPAPAAVKITKAKAKVVLEISDSDTSSEAQVTTSMADKGKGKGKGRLKRVSKIEAKQLLRGRPSVDVIEEKVEVQESSSEEEELVDEEDEDWKANKKKGKGQGKGRMKVVSKVEAKELLRGRPSVDVIEEKVEVQESSSEEEELVDEDDEDWQANKKKGKGKVATQKLAQGRRTKRRSDPSFIPEVRSPETARGSEEYFSDSLRSSRSSAEASTSSSVPLTRRSGRVTTAPRLTRQNGSHSSAATASSDSDTSSSESESVQKRKKQKKVNEVYVSEESDEESDERNMRLDKRNRDMSRPQDEHRKTCARCHQLPTDQLSKHLLAKIELRNGKGKGKKRAREEDEDEDQEDTDDELDRCRTLGAWIECEICISATHFGCLHADVKQRFVAALKAQHVALHTPDVSDPTPSTVVNDAVLPPVVIPFREQIETHRAATISIKKCGDCAKTAKCFGCKKIRNGDAALLFRCLQCNRAIHYECLPREDDDEPELTSNDHARRWIKDGRCHQCADWTEALDVILAWREPAEDSSEEMEEDVADVRSGEKERLRLEVTKSKKDLVDFVLPSTKDVHASAEYLVKWQDKSYRRLEWVPHGFLLKLSPMKLANFLRRGSKIDLIPPIENDIDLGDEESQQGTPSVKIEDEDEGEDSAPAPDPDAEARIPIGWSTCDRVLDVWFESKSGSLVRYCDYRGLPSDPEVSIALVLKGYFKWRDLSYDESTNEAPPTSQDVGYAEYLAAYKAFLLSHSPAMRIPTLSNAQMKVLDAPRDSSKFVPIIAQPDHIVGGKLMKYQVEGVNFLFYQWYRRNGCILADEMGLGKTVQIITLLSSLQALGSRPFLVVVPLSTVSNWLREFTRWAPHLRVVPYAGSHVNLEIIEQFELFDSSGKTLRTHVVLSTYETVARNVVVLRKVVRWDVVVVDEGQRLKSGPKGLLFAALSTLNIGQRILLTGTPLNNNITELFNLLHFINPSQVKDIDAMTERYADLTPELIDEIRAILKAVMLRRTKQMVLDLPPLDVCVVPVTMTKVQRVLYRSVLERNAQAISQLHSQAAKKSKNKIKNKAKLTSFASVLMQLRKTLAHPYLVSPELEPRNVGAKEMLANLVNSSCKLVLLEAMLPKLKAQGHRVLIFSQFKIALDIVEDFLNSLNYKFLRLDGDTSQMDRTRDIDAFNSEDSPYFIYLLSTRAGGVGINLTSASTVVIFDQDFNPFVDAQAIARAHRIGQKKTVRVYKLMCRGTCEERIMAIGNKKLGLDHLIIQRIDAVQEEEEDIASILSFGVREIFEENGIEKVYTDAEIDALLSRVDVVVEKTGVDAGAAFAQAPIWEVEVNQAKEGEGSLQNTEDLTSFWDDVIREQAAAQMAFEEEQVGRGKRRRNVVTYAGDDDSPRKKAKAGLGSDDDFLLVDDDGPSPENGDSLDDKTSPPPQQLAFVPPLVDNPIHISAIASTSSVPIPASPVPLQPSIQLLPELEDPHRFHGGKPLTNPRIPSHLRKLSSSPVQPLRSIPPSSMLRQRPISPIPLAATSLPTTQSQHLAASSSSALPPPRRLSDHSMQFPNAPANAPAAYAFSPATLLRAGLSAATPSRAQTGPTHSDSVRVQPISPSAQRRRRRVEVISQLKETVAGLEGVPPQVLQQILLLETAIDEKRHELVLREILECISTHRAKQEVENNARSRAEYDRHTLLRQQQFEIAQLNFRQSRETARFNPVPQAPPSQQRPW